MENLRSYLLKPLIIVSSIIYVSETQTSFRDPTEDRFLAVKRVQYQVRVKKLREFRLRCKWNKTFWFVPLKIFRNKRNS